MGHKKLEYEKPSLPMFVIFLYKVTFEETKEFYWGIHLQRKKNDGYLGSPVTHAWKWDFYTPKLDILHYFEPSEEGWREACLVEDRVIRPDLNNPLCLNEHVGGRPSLQVLREAQKKGNETNKRRGTGIYGLTSAQKREAGSRGGKNSPEGQHASNGRETHKRRREEPETYRVSQAKAGSAGGKVGGRRNTEKQATARKRNGDISASKTNSQLWRCLVTGKVTTPGALSNFQKKEGIPTHLRERVQ